MTPREYLKIKYAAPTGTCKCGNCQLVPPEMLATWDDEIEQLDHECSASMKEIATLRAENERLRAALREIAAVEPQSWTTRRARAALEQKAPSCAAWPACGCSPHMRRICETTGGKGTLFGPRREQHAPVEVCTVCGDGTRLPERIRRVGQDRNGAPTYVCADCGNRPRR